MTRRRAAPVLALTLAAIVYLPVCDLLFDCGCTWPLLGDWQHCDIHVAGPPDCPLCTTNLAVQGAFWLVLAVPIFGALVGLQRLLPGGAK